MQPESYRRKTIGLKSRMYSLHQELADISVDTVKSIERGRRSMSLDTYLGIVQALETSPSALVNGKQPGKYMERFRYIVDQRNESEIEFVLGKHNWNNFVELLHLNYKIIQ